MGLVDFDYSLNYRTIDFRQHPELYRVGKGEQGVLMVEPYKSEILPYWKFKTPDLAQESAKKIYSLFLAYRRAEDFVGMDMARKFLQMGYTRARRYANHPSGRKYKKGSREKKKEELPRGNDPVKAEAARIFYGYYLKAREDEIYKKMKEDFIEATKKRAAVH